MNILTDILSLIKRKQFVQEVTPEDVIVLGRHEEPDMLGIASPIPYKSVKLIKIKDFIESENCSYINLNNGTGTNPANIFVNKTAIPCTVNLRSIAGIGNNISVAENANEIEISTTGEPNDGTNIGDGGQVYKTKTGETLEFRTLTSEDDTISVSQNATDVILSLNKVILTSPDSQRWEVTIDNAGTLITTPI